MIVYKLFGSILIILAGFVFSRRIAAADDTKLKRTEAVYELIGAVRSRIDAFCMPISEILTDISPEVLIRCGYDSEKLPENSYELTRLSDFTNDAELYRIFCGFFNSLGSSYKSDELARCKLALDELDTLIIRRREEGRKKRKTVPALCMCISLGIVVILF